MVATEMLKTMFLYNHETNSRLLALAERVSDAQWKAPQEAGQRSLHVTLHHILVVEDEWLHLCSRGEPIWGTRPIDDYPDVASLRALNDANYHTFSPWLTSLDDGALAARPTYLMPHGREQEASVWAMLTHMLYHSQQHRSECAFMLTRYGHSPGFIDFFGYGFTPLAD